MAHRLAPHAERDLDDIWLYVAKESGSIDIANRLIDTITERFLVLPAFPTLDGRGTRISDRDTAACPWANT
jgi:plasmid stabilization system protein ParE